MSSMKTKTLNLCVADMDASAVDEVNQAGKLHFSYTGFTISPRHYSDRIESSLIANAKYLHMILQPIDPDP